LQRVLSAREQRAIFFDAEDDAEFGKAVEALDLARAGGAATIAVLTDPLASR
jgi:biopolymer transport protein ExbD/biopolymer transport protein TolR